MKIEHVCERIAPFVAAQPFHQAFEGVRTRHGARSPIQLWSFIRLLHDMPVVNGGQDPRKDGGAKFFGMTFANGLAAPCRRPLGGNQRPGGKRCQRRKPPEAGAEGPR